MQVITKTSVGGGEECKYVFDGCTPYHVERYCDASVIKAAEYMEHWNNFAEYMEQLTRCLTYKDSYGLFGQLEASGRALLIPESIEDYGCQKLAEYFHVNIRHI